MRCFWALMGALVLAGIAVLLVGPRGASTPAPRDPGLAPASPARTSPQQPASTLPAQPSFPANSAAPANRDTTPPSSPSPTPLDIERALDAALGTTGEHAGKPSSATPTPSTATGPTGTPIDLPTIPAHPLDKIIRANAQRLPDGSLRLDGQFTITGSGTQADPYVLPFELLMSAENTFQPRKGLSRLPQRVTFLHDAWVRVTGYVAFPISAADPSELLVMFNQWDGCCIGVPPTAYDAIEVKLDKPARGEQRFSVHGSVTGRFKVDPFIDSNYLLGLYVMEGASFSSDQTDAKLRSTHQAP